MAKYVSNRQKNLRIGISSYTESNTVLEVTGKVGIGTTNAQDYELYVAGDANISGIVSATAFYGSGINLTDLVNTISVSKIDGIEIKNEGVGIGTTFTSINFIGSSVEATSSGSTANVTINPSISILFNDINTGTGSTTINFKGAGISSVTSSSGISTVIVDIPTNLDGGSPTTNYGGIESVNAGEI